MERGVGVKMEFPDASLWCVTGTDATSPSTEARVPGRWLGQPGGGPGAHLPLNSSWNRETRRQGLCLTRLPCPTHTADTPCREPGPEWASLCLVADWAGMLSVPPSPCPGAQGPLRAHRPAALLGCVNLIWDGGLAGGDLWAGSPGRSPGGNVRRLGAVWRLLGTGWG